MRKVLIDTNGNPIVVNDGGRLNIVIEGAEEYNAENLTEKEWSDIQKNPKKATAKLSRMEKVETE